MNFNPRNEADIPDDYEAAALTAFHDDRSLPDYYGFTEFEGEQVFRYLAPMTIEEACLQCHGEPAGELDVTGYPKEGWTMGDIGGAISIVIPLDVYQQSERESIAQDVLFFTVMVAVCLIVVYIALNHLVTRPLGKIQAGVEQVSEGNLNVQLTYSESSREMSALTTKFNAMAHELADTYAGLEDEVADRTAQLQAANEVLERQRHQLEAVNAQLVDENQYKSDFLSMVSHELRTPLTSIVAFADLLSKHVVPASENEAKALAGIEANSQALMLMINDILEISRLEQGNVSMEIKPFDLVQNLETCLSPFQTQAKNQGKTFQLSIDVKNRMIKGDPARLSQVLNNLVSNSMKFTRTGDRVSVTLRQMDEGKRNNYLFIVEDTGAGMSEEFLPKLFDPYEREVRFGAKEVTGTGLGMPIVKNLVVRMGGQIVVNSTLGQGTTFSVTIPFDAGEAISYEPEEEPQDMIPLKDRHILLAEDNLLNMEIATELLKMRGADVTPAEDGRKALEAFQAAEPYYFDAVLMDMQMPEMDGCESTQAIRALDRPDARTTPIIALTANAFAEDIVRTTQAGMDAHLAKPINIEQLCATLTKLMSQRDGQRGITPTEGE